MNPSHPSEASATESRIRLAVDIGGTFTDVVVETSRGRHTKKVLTTPAAPEAGVMDGMLGVLGEAGLSVGAVEVIIHGTTLATNAIIERKGARTALIATNGFRDTLDIADEGRYDQYDVNIDKPRPHGPIPCDDQRDRMHRVGARTGAEIAMSTMTSAALSQIQKQIMWNRLILRRTCLNLFRGAPSLG